MQKTVIAEKLLLVFCTTCIWLSNTHQTLVSVNGLPIITRARTQFQIFYFSVWLLHAAGDILVSQSGMNPTSDWTHVPCTGRLEVWILNTGLLGKSPIPVFRWAHCTFCILLICIVFFWDAIFCINWRMIIFYFVWKFIKSLLNILENPGFWVASIAYQYQSVLVSVPFI